MPSAPSAPFAVPTTPPVRVGCPAAMPPCPKEPPSRPPHPNREQTAAKLLQAEKDEAFRVLQACSDGSATPDDLAKLNLVKQDVKAQGWMFHPTNDSRGNLAVELPRWPVARPAISARDPCVDNWWLRQAFSWDMQSEQFHLGLPVMPPCVGCGLPTIGFCDFAETKKSTCDQCGGTDNRTLATVPRCIRGADLSAMHGGNCCDNGWFSQNIWGCNCRCEWHCSWPCKCRSAAAHPAAPDLDGAAEA
jgi:hypothetical protein